MWAALVTRTFGARTAIGMLDLYEDVTGTDPLEVEVDRDNYRMGAKCGIKGRSDQQRFACVIAHSFNGNFKYVNGYGRIRTLVK